MDLNSSRDLSRGRSRRRATLHTSRSSPFRSRVGLVGVIGSRRAVSLSTQSSILAHEVLEAVGLA